MMIETRTNIYNMSIDELKKYISKLEENLLVLDHPNNSGRGIENTKYALQCAKLRFHLLSTNFGGRCAK